MVAVQKLTDAAVGLATLALAVPEHDESSSSSSHPVVPAIVPAVVPVGPEQAEPSPKRMRQSPEVGGMLVIADELQPALRVRRSLPRPLPRTPKAEPTSEQKPPPSHWHRRNALALTLAERMNRRLMIDIGPIPIGGTLAETSTVTPIGLIDIGGTLADVHGPQPVLRVRKPLPRPLVPRTPKGSIRTSTPSTPSGPSNLLGIKSRTPAGPPPPTPLAKMGARPPLLPPPADLVRQMMMAGWPGWLGGTGTDPEDDDDDAM